MCNFDHNWPVVGNWHGEMFDFSNLEVDVAVKVLDFDVDLLQYCLQVKKNGFNSNKSWRKHQFKGCTKKTTRSLILPITTDQNNFIERAKYKKKSINK